MSIQKTNKERKEQVPGRHRDPVPSSQKQRCRETPDPESKDTTAHCQERAWDLDRLES